MSRNIPIPGLYFDGRKDKTLVASQKGNKWYRKREIEDHYVIVSEPGSVFFGPITVQSGSARAIKSEIIKYLNNKSVDLSALSVVGCDGTVVNTAYKGGVRYIRMNCHCDIFCYIWTVKLQDLDVLLDQ